MRSRRSWLGRGLAVAILTVPLLASGPCVQVGQSSAITGFFNGLTAVMVQQLQDRLGLTDSTTQTTDTTGASQNAGP
jgi:hypothetical protein